MTERPTAETWTPVSPRWFAYRPEPLMQERFWGCDLPLPEELRARSRWWWDEAGFDGAGRPVGWRQRQLPGGAPAAEEVVSREGDARVLRRADGVEVRTTFDGDGRALRSAYRGVRHAEPGVETYEYDDAGRLVAIEEYPGLHWTVDGSQVQDTGGRLTIEHDDDGVVRIREAHGAVRWERPSADWPATLAAHADRIAASCLGTARDECRRSGTDPATEVFALTLIYVEDGGLHVMLGAGLEEDRRALDPDEDPHEASIRLLYPSDEPLFADGEVGTDPELDDEVFREACVQQPDDPHRVVLGAAAARLSTADWSGVLMPTEDFVVLIAEHDEDVAPKLRSIREHNPPDRVARWEASWPAAVLAMEDEDEFPDG